MDIKNDAYIDYLIDIQKDHFLSDAYIENINKKISHDSMLLDLFKSEISLRRKFFRNSSKKSLKVHLELFLSQKRKLSTFSGNDEYFSELLRHYTEDVFFSTLKDYCRKRLVLTYSFAITCLESINEIKKYAPIIEIGAGNGYWSSVLQKNGCEIIPVDKPGKYNDYFGKNFPTYCDIRKDGCGSLKHFPNHNLFLCWPPYDKKMASNALSKFKGNFVIYIGEGTHGCTGDDKFHDMLIKDWNIKKRIHTPKFEGCYDYLTIYKRKVKTALQYQV